MMRRRQPSRRRRLIIWGGVAVGVILIIGAYTFYSINAWNKSNQAATALQSDLKSLVDNQLAADTPSSNNKAALDSIVSKYTARTSGVACQLPLTVQWQEVLWFNKAATERCEQQTANARNLVKALEGLQGYVTQADNISRRISTVATAAAAKKADYDQAKATWNSYIAEAKKEKLDPSADPVRNKAVEVATNIATAYDTLQKADKAEDRAKYDTAKADLEKSYKTIATVSATAQDGYTPLLDSVIKAYDKL